MTTKLSIQRMEQDLQVINFNIDKLKALLQSDEYLDVSPIKAKFVEMQLAGMLQYSFFLEQRIVLEKQENTVQPIQE